MTGIEKLMLKIDFYRNDKFIFKWAQSSTFYSFVRKAIISKGR